jgi:probable rRNA maturation factor
MPSVTVSALARSPVPTAALVRLARSVIAAERTDVIALSITIVGDRRMRTLNHRHLHRDQPTDVIAFSFTALPPYRPTALIGDVYINADAARRQSRALNITAREEMRRLVVHGVLHVLGHDHPAGDDRTHSPMWRRQERYLKAFGK